MLANVSCIENCITPFTNSAESPSVVHPVASSNVPLISRLVGSPPPGGFSPIEDRSLRLLREATCSLVPSFMVLVQPDDLGNGSASLQYPMHHDRENIPGSYGIDNGYTILVLYGNIPIRSAVDNHAGV